MSSADLPRDVREMLSDGPELAFVEAYVVDINGLLRGKRETGRDNFYFDRAGVRQGKWKYLKPQAFFFNYSVEDDREMVEELYDLEADLGEQTNLAAKFPEKVAELGALMRSIEGPGKPAAPGKK